MEPEIKRENSQEPDQMAHQAQLEENPETAWRRSKAIAAGNGAVVQWYAQHQGELPSSSGEFVGTPDDNDFARRKVSRFV